MADRSPARVGKPPSWWRMLAAVTVLLAAMALPNRLPASFEAVVLPVELPLLLAILLVAAWSRRGALLLGLAAAVALAVAIVLKLADMVLFASLSRPFNAAYDLPLAHAGWMLLSGSSGPVLASIYVALLVTALAATVALIVWSVATLCRAAAFGRRRYVALVAATACCVGVAAALGAASPQSTRIVGGHVSAARAALHEIEALARETQSDAALTAVEGSPLSALAGTDVFVIFVESYGRSNFDNPLYAATTRTALAAAGRSIAAAGYEARSGWLTSPTVGGQSWLAHGTLLSGLWIDSQGRYDALMRSRRKSLNRIAMEAGWKSVAVMPAIVLAWPEAEWFGYDRVLAARDLGYRGKPFNWVTMPDQYTLSAFERLVLDGRERPVFAEIALISSHAPWTPIPRLVPWDEVGDGRIFDAQASAGDPPAVVWADRDRVRDQFRQSIDYALRTIGSFAPRHGGKPLFVVLGDHQPAGFVSGSPEVREVPIHVFGDPSTMALIDDWGFSEGLVPTPDAPVWRMDEFRARFLATFSRHTALPPSHPTDPA